MAHRKSQIPGPGYYKIESRTAWPSAEYTAPVVICFFQGAESCSGCEDLLYGDYYKNSSGRTSLCYNCFKTAFDSVRRSPCFFRKVRHCIAYHKHIGVESIVYHKTTSRKIRRLGLMEKRMWNKFGDMLDFYGKPQR